MKTITGLAGLCVLASVASGQSFVNWESPHVSPIGLTPDGSRLLVANTADNRIEVFAITGGGLTHLGSVPVGLDPVSVRARTNTEVWSVNHISDTISIIDLTTMNVIGAIHTGDEPADVVFAGSPQRAFVTLSQLNQVKVYDPQNPTTPLEVIDLEGEDPRALATDGTSVYVAIFESGNNTTILHQQVVSSALNPYPGDENPPPNDGASFNPPIGGGLPTPPVVSLIVKKDGSGVWRDDNMADWSAAVTWDLHDHDVAIIGANAPHPVSYATGLMNFDMALAVKPSGDLTVVGTDAINEIRFVPNLQGIFVRVMGATVSGAGAGATVVDLNPHLDYSTPTVSQTIRDLSLGDPRGIAWRSNDRGFITGMGSNNVAVVDGGLGRIGLIEVGAGPTGAVYDAINDRVYVVNKFEGSISIIDAAGLTETGRVGLYDPTPAVIRDGRPFLYDTHRTSGLGQSSCASCHADGRMDQVSWDLGDPSGTVKPFNQTCQIPGACEDWHPMKGPMITQTLIGIIGTEPFHWRSDQEDLTAFNPAFTGLLGDDVQLTTPEMNQYIAFIATLTPPPNPFRNLDNTLAMSIPLPGGAMGNPQAGETDFLTGGLDGIDCGFCHTVPTGTNSQNTPGAALQEPQSMKVPQLRNMYEKTGFDATSTNNNRGFGFIHDGSVDTLLEFLRFDAFQFIDDAQRRDVEAFMMSLSTDTHAGVGAQAILPQPVNDQGDPVGALLEIAAVGEVALVVKGIVNGEHRGYYQSAPGTFQSDRAAVTVSEASLLSSAGPGSELVLTLVPLGSEVRIGVDRDEDGHFDRDEIDAGSDPADPASTPNNVVLGDLDGDGLVGITDMFIMFGQWGTCPQPCPPSCLADLDDDCLVGITDLFILFGNWS